jgi:hypothetical protein
VVRARGVPVGVAGVRVPAAVMMGAVMTAAMLAVAVCPEPGDRHGAETDTAEGETECVEIHRSCAPRL